MTGMKNKFVCLFDGVWRHFQQYFSYIVAVSFIGGGNRYGNMSYSDNTHASEAKFLLIDI
jgi:hypothetical protein